MVQNGALTTTARWALPQLTKTPDHGDHDLLGRFTVDVDDLAVHVDFAVDDPGSRQRVVQVPVPAGVAEGSLAGEPVLLDPQRGKQGYQVLPDVHRTVDVVGFDRQVEVVVENVHAVRFAHDSASIHTSTPTCQVQLNSPSDETWGRIAPTCSMHVMAPSPGCPCFGWMTYSDVTSRCPYSQTGITPPTPRCCSRARSSPTRYPAR